jgi:Ca-activated chloride channel family protein
MARGNTRSFILITAAILVGAASIFADGFIIIVPPPEPRPEPVQRLAPLAVRKHVVKVDIDGLVATTEVDQVFYNPNNMQLEGEYIFPLPEGASIKDFTLYINGEPVKAELLDADTARKTYEDIVRRMRDPALLEYSGRGLFRARIFPIPALGERRIVLKYSETLSPDADLWSYRYPLNTEKFSSAALEEVSVEVNCRSKRRIQGVYSASHPSGKIEKAEDGKSFKYSWQERNIKPDKDFTLHFVTEQGMVTAAPVVHKSAGDDGYFMLLVSVGSENQNKDATPKDIIFVVDTSGSMRGDKIEQARKALQFCVQGLSEGDNFNVISFSTGVHPFYEKLMEANKDNIKDAVGKIGALESTGGTNMAEALGTALQMMGDRTDRPGYVVFLTDGQPTVGDTSPDGISGTTTKANKRKARLFVFGVGDDLNAILLDRLSSENRGVKTYVGDKEDLEIKVSSFYSKISHPALSDVKLKVEGVDAYDIYPKEMPDLFFGQELAVYGRFKGEGKGVIIMDGTAAGKRLIVKRDAVFPAEVGAEAVPRLWATQKIASLLEEIRLEGETQTLKDEVVRLAKKYGVITPYTSMLVLEDEKVGRTPSILRRAAESAGAGIPAGQPAPVMEMDRKAQEAKQGFASDKGKDAVEASKAIGGMNAPTAPMEAGRMAEDMSIKGLETAVKHLADKTFYLVGGYWQDADFDPAKMQAKEIKFLSDEYFELLKNKPAAGKYFALGEKVIVVIDGQAWKVTP